MKDHRDTEVFLKSLATTCLGPALLALFSSRRRAVVWWSSTAGQERVYPQAGPSGDVCSVHCWLLEIFDETNGTHYVSTE